MQLRTYRPQRAEDGASGVEYGLLLSVIVLVVVAAISLFGSLVSNLYAAVF